MDDRETYVNLETLANGAAVERFNDAWDEAMKNIKDPNTSPTAAREVVLKVKIKPSEDRDRAQIKIECTPKLAPAKPVDELVYISKLGDKAVAVENNPRQPRLYDHVATAGREV